MAFIDKSWYAIMEESYATKNLLYDLKISIAHYELMLTERINDILKMPTDNVGHMVKVRISSLLNLCITNEIDLIYDIFNQICVQGIFRSYIITTKFILRFCSLNVIELLMKKFDFKSQRYVLDINIICERHDDNLEVLEYLIKHYD
jgi:hypothetical protein